MLLNQGVWNVMYCLKEDSVLYVPASDVYDKSDYIRGYTNFIGLKYCLDLNSNLEALILTIRALGIGEDYEVIVPTNIGIAIFAVRLYVLVTSMKLIGQLVDKHNLYLSEVCV